MKNIEEEINKYSLNESEFSEESTDLHEHFRFIADKGQNLLRIDKFLTDRIMNVSRNRIQQAAEAGCIFVNEIPVKSNYKVKPGDIVSVMMTYPPHELEIIPEEMPLNIVYEDQDLLVVNKPPGLVVHPGHGNYTGTLVNGIAWHLRNNPYYDPNDPDVGLVHRIDKDTSGLLLIAKNADAKSHLGFQFYKKTTQRTYNALVWGIMKDDEGTIVGNLGRDPYDKLLIRVFPEGDYGKPAVTHYKVLERLGYVTLVECQLETGRPHQIRVHMQYIGHTIFNDDRYGGSYILKGNHTTKYKQFIHNCFEICPRQALHAKTLGFIHPRTEERMYFDSNLPDDMSGLLDKWRKYVTSED